ncbi:unnamed protein product, partial [Brenthis ino]
MDEVFKDPVQFSKGVKMDDLLNGASEFHIDTDFKKKSTGMMVTCDDDLFPDMDENDSDDDAYKSLEESVSKLMLSCPEYHSFSELSSKMIDCVPSGAVKMMILEEGSGPLVPSDAIVTVHYAAYFENAKIPFDSTLTMNCGNPLCLTLGNGRFIPGLEIGLTCVKGPQARFLLLLKPEVAWGKNGVLPRIRPEPALFVISLYDVEDVKAGARFNSLPKEEQQKFKVTINTVKSIHSRAKKLFTKKKFIEAIREYQQSISILNVSKTDDENELNELKIYKINSYTNIAICYFKLNKPKHTINMLECLDFITDIEKHCKALFYYGRACEMLNKTEEALTYYRKARKLEPGNKEIGDKLSTLEKYNKTGKENIKVLWQNAFKSVPEKKVTYSVDEVFKNDVTVMCQDLAGNEEFAKFEIPMSLSKDELACIKDLSSKFDNLVVLEEGEGKNKTMSIVRKVTGAKMIRFLILAAFLQCTISQQYQQKVAPGVPPQNYQNYQPPPPPQMPQQSQQQQYQQPPQQQYQQSPQQQYQQPPQQPPQQVPQQQYQQQVPVQPVPAQNQQGHGHDPQLLNAANIAQEREHIQEHMDVPIDTSKMSEQELQFHYFKMHDADNNNKLDGCELIKSLIHWHEQGHNEKQPGAPPVGEKIFKDDELTNLIDPILNMDDHNRDGEHGGSPVIYTDKQIEALLEEALKHTDLNNDDKDGKTHEIETTYKDEQLSEMIDEALKRSDKNNDGFIDYAEYKSITEG